ncbi:MAG: dTDP-4-dehydrorhamnose reductase [Geminicoccaceae bacterium]
MPLKVLITGASGQLGQELMARAGPAGFALVGFGHGELDIADRAAVERAMTSVDPDLVVNAAAYTAVDQAESEPERAFAINAEGPRHLARACAGAEVPLIHVSTDYVFDGAKREGYVEDDPVAPLQVYGASKEAGERAVREELAEHLIVRTAWVYSSHHRNFVLTMRQLAAERDELRVVGDQFGSPTWAGELADAICAMAARIEGGGKFGTYHFVGGGSTSWAGFAQAVMDLCPPAGRAPPRVVPIPAAEFPRPARRPASSVLRCGKIGHVFGITPKPWRDALAEVARELRAAETPS